MEEAMVSAATGALKPVLEKLGALVGEKYKRFKGARGEIKSLTRELTAMEAFLLKMSEEEDPDVQDKVWMNEVRELSYDMEDSIDEFMQSVGSEDSKPNGFLEKMKNALGKMKARHRIGNEIQDLKKQIIEVAERNERYKAREAFSKAKNTSVDPRALAIFQHASKLVGIDEPKAEIIKLLTQGASTQEKMNLVSIVGSGGMGKTTLANQVYQDLKGEFKCRAFLSVSRNPDMMNIMRTIFSEVSGKDYANTEAGSIQQLISKIADFLADKSSGNNSNQTAIPKVHHHCISEMEQFIILCDGWICLPAGGDGEETVDGEESGARRAKPAAGASRRCRRCCRVVGLWENTKQKAILDAKL